MYNKPPETAHLRRYGAEGYYLRTEVNDAPKGQLRSRGVHCKLVGYSETSLEYIVLLDNGKLTKVSTAAFLEEMDPESVTTTLRPLKKSSRVHTSTIPTNIRRQQARKDFDALVPDRSEVGYHNLTPDTSEISVANIVREPMRREPTTVKKINH